LLTTSLTAFVIDFSLLASIGHYHPDLGHS
jgi:hypothetical protein